jgi:hypothetical protein
MESRQRSRKVRTTRSAAAAAARRAQTCSTSCRSGDAALPTRNRYRRRLNASSAACSSRSASSSRQNASSKASIAPVNARRSAAVLTNRKELEGTARLFGRRIGLTCPAVRRSKFVGFAARQQRIARTKRRWLTSDKSDCRLRLTLKAVNVRSPIASAIRCYWRLRTFPAIRAHAFIDRSAADAVFRRHFANVCSRPKSGHCL